MLRANLNSPGGPFGSSRLPPSAPSRMTSPSSELTPARSSKIDNGTPVHSAFPTAPNPHCTPFTFGSRKSRFIPRALQRHGNFSRFQLQQLIVAKLEWFLHFAFYSQPPFVFVDLRNREM